MRRHLDSLAYHIRETAALFWTNRVSNLLSLLSTVLVFLFLGLLLIGWRLSAYWVDLIRAEAEIQVFVKEETTPGRLESVAEQLRLLPGVAQVSIIPAEEAGVRMGTLLGAQADMLAHLEENPFRSFLELRISLDSLASILGRVEAMPLVELVRDNRDVLDRLMGVERALRLAGLVFGVAVSLFTVVLMSHITRIGVVHNREQIRTLRLLGAPECHIATPFLLFGVLIGGGGGLLAAGLLSLGLAWLPAQQTAMLPFLPMPEITMLGSRLGLMLAGAGVVLSGVGTISGLMSAREHHRGQEPV